MVGRILFILFILSACSSRTDKRLQFKFCASVEDSIISTINYLFLIDSVGDKLKNPDYFFAYDTLIRNKLTMNLRLYISRYPARIDKIKKLNSFDEVFLKEEKYYLIDMYKNPELVSTLNDNEIVDLLYYNLLIDTNNCNIKVIAYN